MCGIQHIISMYMCVCVCVHPLQGAPNFEDSPPENTGLALQTQRTSSIHHLATVLRNGKEMGTTEWVGSKLSASRGEDTIFIYSIQQGCEGRFEMEWGVHVFCMGHLRWSTLTCTNPLYPVSFTHPSHLSCTQSSRDLPGN